MPALRILFSLRPYPRILSPVPHLYARIEPDVKEQAENILAMLGIPASNAINMFYKQIILRKGLPFDVKLPAARPVNVAELNEGTVIFFTF